jgi:NAD(P)-dependent dehydrogenase (short-subunit alcohol dehydrogenase family)
MELAGKVTVVTGAASGIGRAGAVRFAQEGAKVAIADRDRAGLAETLRLITAAGGTAMAVPTDVAAEAQINALIARAERELGPVDLFWSNAGIGTGGGVEVVDAEWQRIWEINLMAHVYAARILVPRMIQRGGGYLLSTASAAGLLSNIGTAPYTVTKHAAVALAEWLAITHGDQGIKVSCLCPQGVDTPMVRGGLAEAADGQPSAVSSVLASGDLLPPETVAAVVVEGIRAERFLILPHPEVLTYWQRKTADVDRWLGGMRRLQARAAGTGAG